MSGIGGNKRLEDRGKAIGMLLTGKTQKEVAHCLGYNLRTVRRWWTKHRRGESLSDKKRSGRPPKIGKVGKIVLAKSLAKNNQSSRKLADKLTRYGYPCSKDTVLRYWVNELGAKAYVRRKKPKITEKQRLKRLNFCRERKNWTAQDWEKVIFSDESPFELISQPNKKNDVV